MDTLKTKTKLKREKPKKRWTEREVRMILNYLQQSADLEVPTAQIYYKKLIEKTKIDATWDLIRWKVRHLKDSFKKAVDWRKSTGAELLASGADASSVEGKILQTCRYYHQLREIFGEKNRAHSGFEVIDCGDSNTMDESVGGFYSERMAESPLLVESSTDVNNCLEMDFGSRTFKEEEESCETASPTPVADEPTPAQSTSNSNPKEEKYINENMKSLPAMSPCLQLADFKAEIFKMKFEFEKEKYEKEFSLNERKMKLEEDKLKADIDLKKLELELRAREIEKDEKLQILQIEKDERVKTFEIEMKYKYGNMQ